MTGSYVSQQSITSSYMNPSSHHIYFTPHPFVDTATTYRNHDIQGRRNHN